MENGDNRNLRIFALAVAIAALLCMACSSPASPDGEVTLVVGYEDFRRGPNYAGTIDLLAGGVLTVKLFSNTASTGAAWTNPAQLSEPGVLEQISHSYVPLSDNPGGGGQDVWAFHSISKGTCRVYMEYKRAFDTVPSWTFALTVTVR